MKKNMKRLIIMACLGAIASVAHAQLEVRTEAQVSVSSGDNTPLWLNANKYGLSSLKKNNGYVRAGLFQPMENDDKKWDYSYGIDFVAAGGYTSKAIVQQAYGELRWLKGQLTAGIKEQPMELKNQELSSGSQTLGINARPLPAVRIALPDYWTVPLTKGWVGLKGHVSYGLMTDDSWQRDFTNAFEKRTEHAKIHTKAGYLRFGKEDKPLSVEVGLEMACQYGGTTYTINPYPSVPGTVEYVGIKNKDGISGMFHALIPTGGETGEGLYENASGNHLGSYVLRINYKTDKWEAALYADHFFEDHSQMFFIDYDGYGKGAEFNERKDNRYFGYSVKDIMIGGEVKLNTFPWLNAIVMEYIYTKYQSGPVYHDRTYHLADHIAGCDDYYNNYMQTGWQHWGQVMGNPLYRSPLYNTNGKIKVENNRFWAWHFGFSGDPVEGLHYRVLATWQRGWGTYYNPLFNPERNMSLLAEASYRFGDRHKLSGWGVKAGFGLDHGKLLGNNTGAQVTISKHFNIKK